MELRSPAAAGLMPQQVQRAARPRPPAARVRLAGVRHAGGAGDGHRLLVPVRVRPGFAGSIGRRAWGGLRAQLGLGTSQLTCGGGPGPVTATSLRRDGKAGPGPSPGRAPSGGGSGKGVRPHGATGQPAGRRGPRGKASAVSGSPLRGGGATRTVEVAFPALPWGERFPREHARAARDPLAPSAADGAPGRGGWRCVLGARRGIPGSQEGRRTQPPPQVSSHVTPRSPQGPGARPKGTEASSPWGGALAPGSWPPSPPEPPTVWLTQCRNLPSPPSPRQASPCPSGH